MSSEFVRPKVLPVAIPAFIDADEAIDITEPSDPTDALLVDIEPPIVSEAMGTKLDDPEAAYASTYADEDTDEDAGKGPQYILTNGMLARCIHGFILHRPGTLTKDWRSPFCIECFPDGLPISADECSIEYQVMSAGFGILVRKFVGLADKDFDTAAGWESRLIAHISEKWKLIVAAGKNPAYVERLRKKNPQLTDAEIESGLQHSYVKKMFQNLLIDICDPTRSSEAYIQKNSVYQRDDDDDDSFFGNEQDHTPAKSQKKISMEESDERGNMDDPGEPELAAPIFIDVYRFKLDPDGFLASLYPYLRELVETFWNEHPELRPKPRPYIIGLPDESKTLKPYTEATNFTHFYNGWLVAKTAEDSIANRTLAEEDWKTILLARDAERRQRSRKGKRGRSQRDGIKLPRRLQFTAEDIRDVIGSLPLADYEFICRMFTDQACGTTYDVVAAHYNMTVKQIRTWEKKVSQAILHLLLQTPTADAVRTKMKPEELLINLHAENARNIALVKTPPPVIEQTKEERYASMRPRMRQAHELRDAGKVPSEIAAIMKLNRGEVERMLRRW